MRDILSFYRVSDAPFADILVLTKKTNADAVLVCFDISLIFGIVLFGSKKMQIKFLHIFRMVLLTIL